MVFRRAWTQEGSELLRPLAGSILFCRVAQNQHTGVTPQAPPLREVGVALALPLEASNLADGTEVQGQRTTDTGY